MKLKQLFGRRKEDADLTEELQAHIQHEIDDNIARGMNPREAAFAARRKFGNVTDLCEPRQPADSRPCSCRDA